jgi:glycine/D-amino acid oxidase-like deaminating enzyme
LENFAWWDPGEEIPVPLLEARAVARPAPRRRSPHPEHPTSGLLGGGSGHGLKHGPALAERAEQWLTGAAPPEPLLALADRAAPASLSTSRASPHVVTPKAT